jgi:hypothetical protein
MRLAIFLAALLTLSSASAIVQTADLGAAASTHVAAAQQQPSGQAKIDVNINKGGGAWWTSPVWIAIGILALLVVIVLIALVTRGGGGTTIVRG